MELERWEKENVERGVELVRIDFTNLKTGGRARLHINSMGINTNRREIREALETMKPEEVKVDDSGKCEASLTSESMLAACLEYMLTPKYRARRFRKKRDVYDEYFREYCGAFLQGKRGNDLARAKRDLRNDYLANHQDEIKIYHDGDLHKAGRSFDRVMERRLVNYRAATNQK